MCKQSLCQNAELPRMSRASYTQYSDQETVAPRPIPDREMITQLGESAVEQLAQRLPHLLREKQLKWSESDKIFASRWITESNVLVGTKCNKVRSSLNPLLCVLIVCGCMLLIICGWISSYTNNKHHCTTNYLWVYAVVH